MSAESFQRAADSYWTPDPEALTVPDPDPDARPYDAAGWYPDWTGPDPCASGRPDRCYSCGRADGRTRCGGLLCHDCLDGTPDGIVLPF
jgi:hypothetical protein